MYKKLYHTGLLAYLVLFVFSFIFYIERDVYTDIALHLFSIIRDNKFAIQNFRFVAIGTQLLPLLARKLEISLNGIMYVYSVSFVLYYAACYIICGSVLKRYEYAIIILFCNILFASDTFYVIQSELPQAITLLLVVLAYTHNRRMEATSPIPLSLVFLGLFAASFSHPLLLIPFIYYALYLLLSKDIVTDRKLLYTIVVFYIGMVVLKNVVFQTPYESSSMGSSKRLLTSFPHYFKIYSNKRFLLNCLTKYYWIPILSVMIIARYFVTKQWSKMALYLSFFIGYLLLINVSYPGRDTDNSYIEKMYLSLSIFVGLPFVFEIIPILEGKKLAYPVFVLILLSGCIRIYGMHDFYTQRINWERRFLNANGTKKILMDTKLMPVDTMICAWGTPYEFWLLSTVEKGYTASITIMDDPNSLSWAMGNTKAFLHTWGSFPYYELPKKYFIF